MDHRQACPYCDKYNGALRPPCSIYNDISWMQHTGCPHFPYRTLTKGREYMDGDIVTGKARQGQQKQKKQDRPYSNAKSKRKFGYRSID